MVFSTEPTTPIVVERVFTRTIDAVATTSMTLGATTRPDGYVANTWYVGLGPTVPTDRVLALYNNTSAASVVTLQAITPAGVQTVTGFADIPVAAGAIHYLDITDAAVGSPADRALDHPAVRRTDPAARTRRPGPRGRVGRPRQRLTPPFWAASDPFPDLGGLRCELRAVGRPESAGPVSSVAGGWTDC